MRYGSDKELLKRKVRIFDIEVILITHLHGDHFFDLPYLILLRSFNEVTDSLKIYGPKTLRKVLKLYSRLGLPIWKILSSFLSREILQ